MKVLKGLFMDYEKNLNRLELIAEVKGLTLNEDQERVQKVVGLMTDNFKDHGHYFCPCKQINDIPEKGVDVICPCPELDAEIENTGACHCRLFYKQS